VTAALFDETRYRWDMGAVVLVFPRTSYRVEPFVHAAKRMGVDMVLATDLAAPFASLGLPTVEVPLGEPANAARAIAAFAPNACGVVPTDDLSALVSAHTAALLGLPHASVESARAARDKREMRERLHAAGVASPVHRVLPRGAEVGTLGDVAFPCVVKPPMLTGSQGVIRADHPRELEAAVSRCRRILEANPSESRRLPGFFDLLVEDYLPGDEVTVEGLMRDGALEVLAVFDKPDPLEGPFFEETLYVTPSRLAPGTQDELRRVAEDAANALGLRHGAVHVELRVHRGRASVVELAGRSIGGLCSRTVELVMGPLEDLLVAHAAGLPRPAVPADREGSGAAGVMMIPIPRSGVLKRVEGVERARAVDGVVDVHISARIGQSVRALPEGASYLGFVFATGPGPEDAERALRRAHHELRFELAALLA
jgi:biotin carboxylase